MQEAIDRTNARMDSHRLASFVMRQISHMRELTPSSKKIKNAVVGYVGPSMIEAAQHGVLRFNVVARLWAWIIGTTMATGNLLLYGYIDLCLLEVSFMDTLYRLTWQLQRLLNFDSFPCSICSVLN